MIEFYFEDRPTLIRLRGGPSGGFLDDFARALQDSGYSWWTARRYLRIAAHLGVFLDLVGIPLASALTCHLQDFVGHLAKCQCPDSGGGRSVDDTRPGAALFLQHLKRSGVVVGDEGPTFPPVIESFRRWLQRHRGVAESTLYRYSRAAGELLDHLGQDFSHYDARGLRTFVLEWAREHGTGSAKSLVTALRVFLRFLATEGLARPGLDQAIPTVARWRLASLPRYLPCGDVERTIQACDARSPMGQRDRAIVLLLARLGLRAGDASGLRLSDIDWADASLLVSGKGRREVRLPLPQDVGDAILKYLESRPTSRTDHVFVHFRAPFGAFQSGSTLSSVVARAMRRAGVVAPSYGAHILRHTAATEMLRQGASLYEIGAVLRHRSIDMSAYYAKVDVALLRQVAQPWPGGL